MKVSYLVEIPYPENHLVHATLNLTGVHHSHLEFFLPVWSPGSYMVREYSRHIRTIQALDSKGVRLELKQTSKNTWTVSTNGDQLTLKYEIYLHELTVRTSHVDAQHAFLHGPSYLIGIKDYPILEPLIEFKFPPLWSKLSTSLSDASPDRERFIYQAKNYDELIDSPVEIGCHETDGFYVQGVEHGLAIFGDTYPHKQNLKEDIKKIVQWLSEKMGGVPYERYQFILHLAPQLYGGLEHLNSTAIHFDSRKFNSRKDYLHFLALVAHEYFHLWNVKRIRPLELGPFDYSSENYTRLLWLAEGLTSFVDEWFIYQMGLCTLEEYLEMQKSNYDQYLKIPGKKFHSLEESSFNAWIKLYRPDENSKNSSISYYLKGGLVFFILQSRLSEQGRSIHDLLELLWTRFKQNPDQGVKKEEIYEMIRILGGDKIVEEFSWMVETTVDLPYEQACSSMGLELKWNQPDGVWTGLAIENEAGRLFIKSVLLDSPGYRAGLNAGDELIFINQHRLTKEDVDNWSNWLLPDQNYEITISRLGRKMILPFSPEKSPKLLKEIAILDREKVISRLK